jgi:hypothetical protein
MNVIGNKILKNNNKVIFLYESATRWHSRVVILQQISKLQHYEKKNFYHKPNKRVH